LELAYENFRRLKDKFCSHEEELDNRAADFQQAVKEYPTHAPNDLNTIHLEKLQVLEKHLSFKYGNLRNYSMIYSFF